MPPQFASVVLNQVLPVPGKTAPWASCTGRLWRTLAHASCPALLGFFDKPKAGRRAGLNYSLFWSDPARYLLKTEMLGASRTVMNMAIELPFQSLRDSQITLLGPMSTVSGFHSWLPQEYRHITIVGSPLKSRMASEDDLNEVLIPCLQSVSHSWLLQECRHILMGQVTSPWGLILKNHNNSWGNGIEWQCLWPIFKPNFWLFVLPPEYNNKIYRYIWSVRYLSIYLI